MGVPKNELIVIMQAKDLCSCVMSAIQVSPQLVVGIYKVFVGEV